MVAIRLAIPALAGDYGVREIYFFVGPIIQGSGRRACVIGCLWGVEIEPGGGLALRHSVLLLNFQNLGVVDRTQALETRNNFQKNYANSCAKSLQVPLVLFESQKGKRPVTLLIRAKRDHLLKFSSSCCRHKYTLRTK